MLKAQVCKTVLRPVLLFAAETWALTGKRANCWKELRMLRWILGVRRKERIRNHDIRRRQKVLCIRERTRTVRLRWSDVAEKGLAFRSGESGGGIIPTPDNVGKG